MQVPRSRNLPAIVFRSCAERPITSEGRLGAPDYGAPMTGKREAPWRWIVMLVCAAWAVGMAALLTQCAS